MIVREIIKGILEVGRRHESKTQKRPKNYTKLWPFSTS